MANLQDSGSRTEFETGAVRDLTEGKGRCDLLPLGILAEYINPNKQNRVLFNIEQYIRLGNPRNLYNALDAFNRQRWKNRCTMILEASIQYEDGMQKYGERNWERGIPLHNFISSAVRHYLKFLRGDVDEPHDRAFVWNILGALWTHKNKPELIDLPFAFISAYADNKEYCSLLKSIRENSMAYCTNCHTIYDCDLYYKCPTCEAVK